MYTNIYNVHNSDYLPIYHTLPIVKQTTVWMILVTRSKVKKTSTREGAVLAGVDYFKFHVIFQMQKKYHLIYNKEYATSVLRQKLYRIEN